MITYNVKDDYEVGVDSTERIIGIEFLEDDSVISTGMVTFSSSDGLKLSHNIPNGLDGAGDATLTVKGAVITMKIGSAKANLDEAKLNKLNDFLNLITPPVVEE